MYHNAKVVEKLSALFTKDEQFTNCIYLFGQKSVGKSNCLNKFFEKSSWITSVVVQAAECYTNNILFETIVNAFTGHKPSRENNYATSASKIDSIEDFVNQMSLMDPQKSYIIAIENSEKLRDMEFNILPIFMSLQELTGLNISCIFVSHIAFEKFGIADMIKLHVPDYSKSDLIEIFASSYKEIHTNIIKNIEKNSNDLDREKKIELAAKLDEDFYRNYLNIFLNVSYKACRDIKELQLMSSKCFMPYYSPVLSGEVKYNDVTNLWRNITKFMKVSLNTSYMRIENFSANEFSSKSRDEETTSEVMKNWIRAFAQTLELPFYAKYLLIASFLASHNDAKTDKRLFMKHHGKERKRVKKTKVRNLFNLDLVNLKKLNILKLFQFQVSEKMNIQFGPKTFTIDRLLAIFYAILDEKVGLTCNLLSQISTLVDLNFLTLVSGENNIMEGTARLQSTIGLEFAVNIGKVVGFNTQQYLTDFH